MHLNFDRKWINFLHSWTLTLIFFCVFLRVKFTLKLCFLRNETEGRMKLKTFKCLIIPEEGIKAWKLLRTKRDSGGWWLLMTRSPEDREGPRGAHDTQGQVQGRKEWAILGIISQPNQHSSYGRLYLLIEKQDKAF